MIQYIDIYGGLRWWLSGKELAYNAGDVSSVPGLGRSPGERNGNPLQFFFPGKSHEQRSLVCYSLWGSPNELDLVTTQ